VVPGVISVGDVANDGRMLAMTSIEDEGSCWGMFEVWKPKPIWEDDDHILVLAFENERWAVLRLGVDGSAEIAVPPVPDQHGVGAFVLPTR